MCYLPNDDTFGVNFTNDTIHIDYYCDMELNVVKKEILSDLNDEKLLTNDFVVYLMTEFGNMCHMMNICDIYFFYSSVEFCNNGSKFHRLEVCIVSDGMLHDINVYDTRHNISSVRLSSIDNIHFSMNKSDVSETGLFTFNSGTKSYSYSSRSDVDFKSLCVLYKLLCQL